MADRRVVLICSLQDPALAEDACEVLMDALIRAGVTDPCVAATLSSGVVEIEFTLGASAPARCERCGGYDPDWCARCGMGGPP